MHFIEDSYETGGRKVHFTSLSNVETVDPLDEAVDSFLGGGGGVGGGVFSTTGGVGGGDS